MRERGYWFVAMSGIRGKTQCQICYCADPAEDEHVSEIIEITSTGEHRKIPWLDEPTSFTP